MRRIVEYDAADGPVCAALLALLLQRGLPVVDPEAGALLLLLLLPRRRDGVKRHRGGREGSRRCRIFAPLDGGTNYCNVR